MRKIFSTDEVHPRDRFDYWHDIACTNIVDHDSTPEHRRNFCAEIETGSVGALDLVLFRNSPMSVAHEHRHIARLSSDDIFLCRQIAGELRLEQDGHRCLLKTGSLSLLDPRLPYSGEFAGASELLVCKIPRHLFEARVGPTRELIAQTLTATEGDDALTSSYLIMLQAHVGTISPTAQRYVEAQLLDLVAVAFAEKLKTRPRISSSRALACLHVRATIEARLSDPDLDAKAVAAAAGLSLRYANSLLADANTSVSRLILDRRLERCRAAFADPGQERRSISAIAFGWGFSDMTHFGRRFKEAYGMLPKDYRKACRDGKPIARHFAER